MGNHRKYESIALDGMRALAKMRARLPDQTPKAQVSPVQVMEVPEITGQGIVHFARHALNGGELAPEMAGRLDQQRHASGFHVLENVLPMATGGIRRRPGLAFIENALSEDSRLIPFVFSATQALCLEFGMCGGKGVLRSIGADGTVTELMANLPFSARIIREMSYAQSADVLFLAHEDMPPCKIMRYGDADWRFETIDWMPSVQPPVFNWVGPRGNQPEGDNRRITLEYVATAIDEETGEESAPCDPWKLWGQNPVTESRYIEIQIKPQPGVAEFRVYKKSAGVFGYIGRITEPRQGDGIYVLEDKNIGPDTEDTPPSNKNPFDAPGNYPSLVFLHQQRLGYASSKKKPLTFWLSQSGNFESMAASVPPDADDAIEATLAAPQANRILWTVSDRSGLAFGTEGGEWMFVPSEGHALAPNDLSFEPQTSYGSNPGTGAIRAAGSILFIQRGGRVVRDLGYSFQDDRYNASDLSILARHITRHASIVSMCFQQEPWSVLWLTLSDGSMAGLTYLREHEVMAWHRHKTAGLFLTCCAIPGPDGNSRVFLVVKRDGIARIETFRQPADTDISDCGIPFTAMAVPTTPDISNEQGSTFGMVRKIGSVKFLVHECDPFNVRCLGDAADGPPMQCPRRPLPVKNQSALWTINPASGWSENPRLEIKADGKLQILAIAFGMELADMAGGQK